MGYDDLYYRQEVGPLAIWTGGILRPLNSDQIRVFGCD